MADVELVIKIDEDMYKACQHCIDNPKMMIDEVDVAIANGTRLPKGHGRLLDEKEILASDEHDGFWYDLVDMPEYIAGVPAIVEADKTGK